MNPQYLGNKDLLGRNLTAFLASRTVLLASVLPCYDWATSLSPGADCVVSGFQSHIEQDVLHFLLKKKIPVIVVLARRLYSQIPKALQEAHDEGRVLFISICNSVRGSRATALARNKYAAEISRKVVFGMLQESSSLYEIYQSLPCDRKEIIK